MAPEKIRKLVQCAEIQTRLSHPFFLFPVHLCGRPLFLGPSVKTNTLLVLTPVAIRLSANLPKV